MTREHRDSANAIRYHCVLDAEAIRDPLPPGSHEALTSEFSCFFWRTTVSRDLVALLGENGAAKRGPRQKKAPRGQWETKKRQNWRLRRRWETDSVHFGRPAKTMRNKFCENHSSPKKIEVNERSYNNKSSAVAGNAET